MSKKKTGKEAEAGQRFNRLVLLQYIGYYGWKHNAWLSKCDCGNEAIVAYSRLTSGQVKSCGCLQKENRIKHGYSSSVEYRAYQNAKDRCTNPNNAAYEDYGGRGIKFLFNCFEEFLEEVGQKLIPEHSINRINNDGHYEKGNVEWSNSSQQRLNQRKRKPKIKGFSLDKQLSFLYNLTESRIKSRRNRGWCEMCVLDPTGIIRCIHIPPWAN
jgi:hypothetical protein